MANKQLSLWMITLIITAVVLIFVININKQGKTISVEYFDENQQLTAKELQGINRTINSLTQQIPEQNHAIKELKEQSAQLQSHLNSIKPGTNDGNVINDSFQHNLVQRQDNEADPITEQWKEREHTNQLVQSFENHLLSQNKDTIWAHNAEQAMHNALMDKTFSNTSIDSINCQATVCKIVANHTDQDSELVFLQQINTKAGFSDTESFYTRHVLANGNVSMTMYLSRDGYKLPIFESPTLTGG